MLQALPLQRLNIKLKIEIKDTINLATNLQNHADSLISNNQIAFAIRNYEFSLQLDDRDFNVSYSHAYLLHCHRLVGNWQQAEEHNNPIKDGYDTGYISVFRAEKAFYMGENASDSLDTAWQKMTTHRNFQWAAPILALRARNHLRLGHVDEALSAIDEAISWANKGGSAELASYLATRGLIWLHLDKMADAQTDVDTAIETNLYPSEFAHIYNCASRVYQKLGTLEKTKDYALQAYTYAWAEGEPYYRWYDLQEAKKQLDSLGLEHPQLKPYDTDNPEKVYMEDEIVAFIEEEKAEKAEKAKKDAESDDYDPFGDES